LKLLAKRPAKLLALFSQLLKLPAVFADPLSEVFNLCL